MVATCATDLAERRLAYCAHQKQTPVHCAKQVWASEFPRQGEIPDFLKKKKIPGGCMNLSLPRVYDLLMRILSWGPLGTFR